MFSKICMSLSRSQRVNIFTDSRWTDWFLSRSLHDIQYSFQKTKIFGSTSIIHLSDVIVSDRCPIKVDPGLCYQGNSFALATPGGTHSVKVVDVGSLEPRAPVSPLCFADHAVEQSVMHAPGFAAASVTPGWHKTMKLERKQMTTLSN